MSYVISDKESNTIPFKETENPVEGPVVAALSRGQRAMWFLWNLNPNGAEYGLPMAWTIRTTLEINALQGALQDLVDRHPVLRTTYSVRDGEPVQLIHAQSQAHFQQVDASGWDADRLHARLIEETHRPFDLEKGPVFRVHLFSRENNEHVLLLNSHHIASDTWSLIILMEELGILYRSRVSGMQLDLPPTGLLYTDFVPWQQQMLADRRGEEHWQYWQTQLAAPPTLDLPTDRPRPPVQSHSGAGFAFQISQEITQELRLLAKQEDVTLYTVLLASFYVLLYRYTGQEDLVVGSPRFGRPPQGYERTVGYFASPCALRTQLAGATPFTQFLSQVRQVLVGAKDHQDFPFPFLVERLGLQRDVSRSPVFQVAFTYQKSHLAHMQGVAAARMGFAGAKLDLSGLQLDSYPLEQHSVKFDLDFVVEEVEGSLRAVCWYNTDLWDRETVGYLVDHYQALLVSVVRDPHEVLDALSMLTPQEQTAYAEWNATDTPFSEACAHHLFEEQVARTPHAPALRAEGREVSYGDLNHRANQLAHYLRRIGLKKGQLVGLSMERSPDLVIGIIGILKAGGAYLPLDPTYPQDRLAYMMEDSGLALLLTQESLRAQFSAVGVQQVYLDADWATIEQEPVVNPEPRSAPADLAYVIYTSGSTGRPKGVLLAHLGLSNLVQSMSEAFAIQQGSRVLQFASFSFDSSVSEIFTALCIGATLYLAPKSDMIPGSALINTINTNAITVVTLPPSVLALLQPEDVPTLKTLVTAGEPCSLELVKRWSAGRRFLNAYGPTEDTVCTTVAHLHPQTDRVTIGRPIANTKVYVLDKHLQPTPLGVAGEVHIAGVGLAMGYLGRPDLTAERFIPNPFGLSGERMYKTGDLARWLPDGRLEFLGRLDHQVKIRGFRIELGELESVIAEYAGIREALVVARREANGDQRLVAYAITHDAAAVTVADVRAYVQSKLPDFMVPAAFVFLDAWPLTPNGKIDRRALPSPPDRTTAASTVLPQNPLEQQISAVWMEVLGLGAVGIDDNFFEVGGHSLSLVKVEVRLKEALGLTVPTMDLFRFPTIRSLAHHLRTSQGAGQQLDAQSREGERAKPRTFKPSATDTDIAIVGMAGRFPGANSVDEFWRNLIAGVESVTDLPDGELVAAGVDPTLIQDPRYVKRKGTLEGVELFDAPFFGYPPREAQMMDPQQRLFLEVGWQALEHAGYSSQAYPGRIGVIGGTGRPGYLLHHLKTNPETAAELFQTTILNEKDFLSTRLAYKLDLRGPALTVQTACSTSLVAVHLACQQLLQGESDMALAGGVSIEVPHGTGYLYQEGHILSPDGHCRAFDAEARGTVRGSGGAVVVLKRRADAVADGDTIWAVIKGSAINNDGSMKVGYTAPSVDGQGDVIEQALQRAGVNPRTIGLVEAHGTATPLGDPIEVAALTQTYRKYTEDQGYCFLGSVKTNVGHLDAAAGVTGLIKTALALHHGVVPATLHFQAPNPKLGLENSPFVVNNKWVEWERTGFPRRAAVSSFGIGGTNAHVILEEAAGQAPTSAGRANHLLMLSAKSERALDAMTTNLAQHVREHPDVILADVAYTLQVGRTHLPHRRVVVCASPSDALEALENLPQRRAYTGTPAGGSPRVIFLFPGQGLQQVNMGRDLYESEPEFRQCVDSCAQLLQPLLGLDLRTVLYPEPHEVDRSAEQLAQTAITQPALFVVEYALSQLLMTWGVQPQAMMGHSLGEYVAACLAGVMSLPDALKLVAARGQLVQQLPGGAMLAVESTPEQIQPFLGAGVDLAVVNGPRACVLAGTTERMEALQDQLTAVGLRWKSVRTSHAFHSAMLDPILDEFHARVGQVELHPPQIPYITNVTGSWVTAEEATDPVHWVRHMRQTVRFAEGLEPLLQEPGGIFLEVGPGQAFSSVIQRHPKKQSVLFAGPTLATTPESSDCATLLTTLGRLWIAGISPEWQKLYAHETRRRIALPVYPFDRHRYWLEARPAATHGEWMSEVAATTEVEYESVHVEYRPNSQVIGPRDEVELELVKVFEEILGMAPVGVTDSFFDLGGSSLSSLSVMIRLEQIFGCSLSNAVLVESPTVEALAHVLRAGPSSHSSRLVGIRTTGNLPPIFCIHPYGGHTTGYFELIRCLGADQPVYGIQSRGLRGESAPHNRFEEMAVEYIDLVKSKQPQGPYILVGHSMGGCIAYEMAQQLRQAGEEVALLALLDSRAQNFSVQPLYRNGAYGQMASKGWLSDEAVMLGILLPKLSMDWEQMRDTPTDEHWLRVLEVAMQQGLLPRGTGEDQLRHLLAVTQANDEALRTYQPKPYEGQVVLFSGEDGFAKQFGEPDLGWGELVSGRLEQVNVPGDHHSIMAGTNVEAIARHLQVRLRELSS
ncbi:non-ribosomal peptide synthetase/type I polyketide synthase [Tumebacillus permanentifrigoris]|uniref:Amino acid adenylation domain-containing protein n=1 Tax=Tumebacillus permanentifrigoris TaxID=378543 RepID=A0A316DX68_9BACL|nr:non-ribosomal peptide synthetase/type I polyketide synthase [Tumebacillus permanentifrigoris]PWK14434.1 amino acid adenylation domain-containing protein [Tumebacillus permanentifrigoris]